MTARKDQPAQLKRRIAALEEALAAEREQSRRLLAAWSDAVWERAELRQRLGAVQAALRGEG
jgi:hypothetical protein